MLFHLSRRVRRIDLTIQLTCGNLAQNKKFLKLIASIVIHVIHSVPNIHSPFQNLNLDYLHLKIHFLAYLVLPHSTGLAFSRQFEDSSNFFCLKV